ncbi:MAG: hypothetical protein HQ503_13045 [Rhodospirillales bacterium]|nr:hypothetical protein [Rhodospirillales bacterium]
MKIMHITALSAIAGAALLISPAEAQKSKNTLRSAFQSPIKGISYYYDPKPDTAMEQAAVYDGLVFFDEEKHIYKPLLAKAWRRVGDKAIEFDLRDDVKWHDGEKFDADDVVYTYGFLIDPKTKIRFKRNWNWIAKVEKLGAYKVRITAKRPTPFDMARHAYLTAMLPEHIHSKLERKATFGLKPVGTGMFKVLQVDKNKGIIMELNDAFKHGGDAKPVTNVKRISFASIPDIGTQIAQYLAGNLDMVTRVPLDQAESIIKRLPDARLTVGQGISYMYMAFDSAGRSGVKPVTDVRVRKAMAMAVDRDVLVKLMTGGRNINRPGAMCWRVQAGCDFDAALPKFDIAGAKKLMAEAGYPNGFNLEITTFNTAAIRNQAQAVAGMLSKIGIKATVDSHVLASYRKKQGQGKIQTIVAAWPAGGLPDVSGTLGFIFRSPPSRNYHGDKGLVKLAKQMGGVMDPAKRRALGKKIFNMATEKAYFIPLGPNPAVVVHSKDLQVKADALNALNIEAWNLRWK